MPSVAGLLTAGWIVQNLGFEAAFLGFAGVAAAAFLLIRRMAAEGPQHRDCLTPAV